MSVSHVGKLRRIVIEFDQIYHAYNMIFHKKDQILDSLWVAIITG